MLTDLLIVALATAGIVHTYQASAIFAPLRGVMANLPIAVAHLGNRVTTTRLVSLRMGLVTASEWVKAGVECSYCLAHWVAGALAVLVSGSVSEWVLLAVGGMWIANHSLGLFDTLGAMNGVWSYRASSAQRAEQIERAKFNELLARQRPTKDAGPQLAVRVDGVPKNPQEAAH